MKLILNLYRRFKEWRADRKWRKYGRHYYQLVRAPKPLTPEGGKVMVLFRQSS